MPNAAHEFFLYVLTKTATTVERVRRMWNRNVVAYLLPAPGHGGSGNGRGGEAEYSRLDTVGDIELGEGIGGIGSGGPGDHGLGGGAVEDMRFLVQPPPEFNPECQQVLIKTLDDQELVKHFTRPIFLRIVFEDVLLSVLGLCGLWLFVTLFANTHIVTIFATVFSLLYAASVVLRLYFAYMGRSWIVVTSGRYMTLAPETFSGKIIVTSHYAPEYPRLELFHDGSGEIRFYTTSDEFALDQLPVSKLTHFPDVSDLKKYIYNSLDTNELSTSYLMDNTQLQDSFLNP